MKLLGRHWPIVLACIVALLAVLNIAAFYPGFMSNDSIDQLGQALGAKPFTDWHPPLMAIVWRLLLDVTGRHVSSMLIWQCLSLWAGFGMLAIYVYRRTRSRRWSLLPLALGALPFVVCISGVIWKDVQMAAALLVATAALLLARTVSGRRSIWSLVLVAIGAMVYAVNMRYNAIAAVVPLFWLLWPLLPARHIILQTKTISWVRVGVVAGVVLASFLLVPVVGLLKPIAATHPVSSQMIDDIVHIYTPQQLAQLPTPPPARQALTQIGQRCQTIHAEVSVWISCATPEELQALSRDQYPALRGVWVRALLHHPLAYAHYRWNQFIAYLVPHDAATVYVWQDGVVQNPYGVSFHPNTLNHAVQNYVSFMHFDFGFLFRPYIWLLTGIGLIAVAWRRRRIWKHFQEVIVVALSGVLYIVAYLPAVAAYDFRYSYWSCIAISVALVLAVIDGRTSRTKSLRVRQRQ